MRQERPLGHGQGAEPHETETLAEGVLMSSGIDFVFQASALYLLFVFFHFYLFSFAVASSVVPTLSYHGPLYSRVCSVICRPTVTAFVELAIFPFPPFPSGMFLETMSRFDTLYCFAYGSRQVTCVDFR
jgi:hypothetical protein